MEQNIHYNLICEHNFEAAFDISERALSLCLALLHSQPWRVKINRGLAWRQYHFPEFYMNCFHRHFIRMSQQQTLWDFFLFFLLDLQRLKTAVCEEEAIVGWGPVSKLQGLEKRESNAWLFVNCLASPWVQPEFVSKKKNKVTWTFSWLFPPASPLFPPFLATGISQSFWRERLPPPLLLQILFPSVQDQVWKWT